MKQKGNVEIKIAHLLEVGMERTTCFECFGVDFEKT